MPRRATLVLVCLLLSAALPKPARAQILSGSWVKASEKSINKNRKTDIRVLVLDAQGNPAAHARVHLDQQQHSFPIGFVAESKTLSHIDWHQPVWRCFSAISLADRTHWPLLQPHRDKPPDFTALASLIRAAQARNLTVRWGPLVSSDLGSEPSWAANLPPAKWRAAVHGYMQAVLTRFGRLVSDFDLFSNTLDHPLKARGLTTASLRRLLQTLKTTAPRARLCLRYHDALRGGNLHKSFSRMVHLQQAFVPLDAVTLTQHDRGKILHLRLAAALSQWDQLGVPIVIDRLIVGGDSPAAAKVNLEVVLRTCFADPNVAGIYLGSLRARDAADPVAALIDKHGKPTPTGKLFDQMFHHLWRTDMTRPADDLGNLRARVFPGRYQITASLPNHQIAAARVWIAAKNHTQLIVLQAHPPAAKK